MSEHTSGNKMSYYRDVQLAPISAMYDLGHVRLGATCRGAIRHSSSPFTEIITERARIVQDGNLSHLNVLEIATRASDPEITLRD